ncbi:Protein DEL-3 [Aphelenchoides avenae]|nr:Protein DEL-3 [Aphelenchus avenae]
MMRQGNASAVCTVNQYNQCVRKYVDMAKPSMWTYEVPTALDRMKSAVDYCRGSVQMPCQRVEFPSNTHEYDLPQEYRNTQDFVARITLSYESLVMTDVLETYEMGFYDFLMFVGYNVALWFAVGHIIWSIVTTPCEWVCDSNKNKVTPKADTAVVATVKPSSSPLRSARNQLPPMQHSPRSGTDKTLTYAVEGNGGPSQMPDG